MPLSSDATAAGTLPRTHTELILVTRGPRHLAVRSARSFNQVVSLQQYIYATCVAGIKLAQTTSEPSLSSLATPQLTRRVA